MLTGRDLHFVSVCFPVINLPIFLYSNEIVRMIILIDHWTRIVKASNVFPNRLIMQGKKQKRSFLQFVRPRMDRWKGRESGNISEEWIRTTDHRVTSVNPEIAEITVKVRGDDTYQVKNRLFLL
jgi:hypothetical protein